MAPRSRRPHVLLTVAGLSAGYRRDVSIVHDISIEVRQGEMVSIIGPNGAGKSTVLRAICGMAPYRAGRVNFEGSDLAQLRTDEILKAGVVFVAQGQNIFPELSVADNLELGAYIRTDRAGIRRDLEEAYRAYPALAENRRKPAGLLSGGQVQILEMARAMLLQPKLLLIDEPSIGLAPKIMHQMFEEIRRLHAAGVAVLIVEQNAEASLRMSDWAYVIESGRNGKAGAADAIRTDPAVRAAYLGG